MERAAGVKKGVRGNRAGWRAKTEDGLGMSRMLLVPCFTARCSSFYIFYGSDLSFNTLVYFITFVRVHVNEGIDMPCKM